MRRAVLFAPFLVIWSAVAVFADARMSVLVDVLKLEEAVLILRQEGLGHAQDLDEDMLNGQGGPGWAVQVDAIYDPQRMVETVRAELETELQGEMLEETITFYSSELGTRIVTLENSARAAIQDPDIEQAARETFQDMKAADVARLDYITHYIETGDMIERNVTSSMNSNFQFLRGMVDGNALEMTEQEMLAEVSSDIEESTQDTTEWLFGFLLLAYHPLADEELDAYIAYSETPAALALNRALFAGFGKAYEDISYALGRAVALNMTAEEL